MNLSRVCNLCGANLRFKLSKYSEPMKKYFDIYECEFCKNWQIYPLPAPSDLQSLYEDNYFSKRTNRGYDNYAGDAVKQSVLSTLQKNLSDLDFFSWENTLNEKSALEIGAAAGFFLEYLQERGWNALGIDISKSMTDAAVKKGLKMIHGDFLNYNFLNHNFLNYNFLNYNFENNTSSQFDLIALWATLEHLPEPGKYIQKISTLLKPDGHLYLTTANTGFWARIYGDKWRYLNVPEHIYYFNKKSLSELFEKSGLKIRHGFTYGSGFTTPQKASPLFKFVKKISDQSAKYFFSGDMIALDVVHASSVHITKS